MTQDEYYALKKEYLKSDMDEIPQEKFDELIKFSDIHGKMPPANALFGGDSFKKYNRMFYRISDVKPSDRSKLVTIQSGLTGLDNRMHGFIEGELTVVSGTNGSGKSTWLSQLTLEAATQGFKSVIFSGELTAPRVKEWLMLQAAGADHTVKNGWQTFVESASIKNIENWMSENIFIYNNEYGLKIKNIMNALNYFTLILDVDVIVLDNLMSMDIRELGKDKYECQAELTMMLSSFAKRRDVHIFFVCHPRKSIGFLRKTDISGTADITNAADNVLIVHRVNNDFKRLTKEFFKWGDDAEIYRCSNAIEICKNRDLGVQDVFAESYFEPETKRFKNSPSEYRHYGWEPDFIETQEEMPF